MISLTFEMMLLERAAAWKRLGLEQPLQLVSLTSPPAQMDIQHLVWNGEGHRSTLSRLLRESSRTKSLL